MKAAKIIAPGQPVFVDAPVPDLQPNTAIVRALRVSLCGSDIRHLHHLPAHRYPTAPGETGHEMVGEIVAIDSPNGAFKPGERVLCLAPDHRAMQEYYRAPVDHLLPFDPQTPLEHAVQAQQLGTVLYASQVLPDIRGKSVAVIGQGSAGLWFLEALRRRGADKIIAIDLKAYRLAYSQRYGATHTICNAEESPVAALREICSGELPDVVIEAAGEAESIRLAVKIARQSGFILWFGVPRFDNMDFPIFELFWKTVASRGMVGAANDPGHGCTRQALEWISSGAVDAAGMLTHSFKFDDVFEAYALHQLQDEGAVKIVIDMEQ